VRRATTSLSSRNSHLRILGLLLFVDLFVLGMILFSLSGSLHQHLDSAEISSRNINQMVSQSLSSEIKIIDLVLQSTTDEITNRHLMQPADRKGLREVLVKQAGRLSMADALRVTDADGNVVVGSDDVPFGISLSDREHFRTLKAHPAQGLLISKPLISLVTGKPILVFARALQTTNGTFAGIIVAPVALDWFSRKFQNLEVGPNGVVVMRGDASRSFDLLARYPDVGFVGQTKVSDIFRAQITANPQSGSYEAKAGADNVQRVFSYQAIENYPLITLVGIARQDFMGSWQREVIKLCIVGAVFIIVSSIGGLALIRSWRILEQRTDELERSNTELEQFAYAASHDLQTPLRNIASYTQLLDRRYRGQMGEDADQFIEFIVGNAKRMSVMIRDLVDYSRATPRNIRLSPVDLGVIVAAVLSRLQQPLAEIGATVTVGELPWLLAEEVWLDSLMRNLLENAIRYRHPKRPLEITIAAEPIGGKTWRISVRDNGIGIAPEYHEKIFGMFYRMDPAQYPDSTGIGLALCRRMVGKFGGRLWVESALGNGSCFLFTLEAADKSASES